MDNANVIIIGLALLVVFIMGGKGSVVAGILSAIMIVGALRHPGVATSAQVVGNQDEQLQGTMVLAALIAGGPVVLWLLRGKR